MQVAVLAQYTSVFTWGRVWTRSSPRTPVSSPWAHCASRFSQGGECRRCTTCLPIRECLTGGFLRAVSHESFVPLQAEQHAAPRDWGHCVRQAWSPFVNILFRTKLFSLAPLSWDMDCLLTLWLTLPLVPLVTWLLYVWFSDLYHSRKKFLVPQPIYTQRKIIKAPLLHQSLGPWVFFCFSLFLADSLEHGDLSCSLSCPGF